MTFLKWLKTQNKRLDPVGDFARDAILDRDRPKGEVTKSDWIDYLNSLNVQDKAIDAFERAWKEYSGKE